MAFMTCLSNASVKTLTKGKYTAFQARGPEDVAAAQHLRAQCFGLADPIDRDNFDDINTHVLVKETATDTLVCCYRLHAMRGEQVGVSYAAQFYDLSAMHSFDGSMMELGRFCVHPHWRDPDILRVAWAALTGFVDANDISMLFGCSSFAGIDADAYLDAFAVLEARHLAPTIWMPKPKAKASDVVSFAVLGQDSPDMKKAQTQMPPLLRTYLMMGGWVSDHAVRDAVMNTMHVFTGLEIGRIPESRKRLLRALI